MKYLFVAALCAAVTAQQKLPSYIKHCDFKSANFKDCALQQANDAFPHIVKGDKHLGIPTLDPLYLPLIDVEQNNFKISLTDVKITGLKNIKATDLNLDHHNFDGTFHIDYLNIAGKYKIDGKVLLLNLNGQGDANITAIGGEYHVKASLSRTTKKGITYLKFEKPTVEFTLQRAYFNFENLLAGNNELGSEINNILNENWQDVLKDVGAPIKETIGSIIKSITSNILDRVPEHEIIS